MNGAAVKSCTVFAVQADGAEITTVEGVERDGELSSIKRHLAIAPVSNALLHAWPNAFCAATP